MNLFTFILFAIYFTLTVNCKLKFHVFTIFKIKIIAESGRKGMLIKVNALPPYNRNDSKSNDKSKKKKRTRKNFFALFLFFLLPLF